MGEENSEKTHEEWLEEEQARLDKGFQFEPTPSSTRQTPDSAEEVLAGLGIGAGVAGAAVAPHENPCAYEGVKADLVAAALASELADDDTRVGVTRTQSSVVVTVLQSHGDSGWETAPALSVTLIETPAKLTVSVGKLTDDTVRETLGSIGDTVVDQSKRLLLRRRGPGALLDAADAVIDGIGDLVEDIQDLGLPGRVWQVIDRVARARENAYLEQKREDRETERKRQAAERAWTHCEWCGRAFGSSEVPVTECPACGAPRGTKPAWL